MGAALVSGLLDGGFEADQLAIAEMDPARRRVLEDELSGVRVGPSASWVVGEADVVIVAVKPGDVAAVLEGALSVLGDDALVLSIAAGVSIAALEEAVPGRPVVRAMPNTPRSSGRAWPRSRGGRRPPMRISRPRAACWGRSARSWWFLSGSSTR